MLFSFNEMSESTFDSSKKQAILHECSRMTGFIKRDEDKYIEDIQIFC